VIRSREIGVGRRDEWSPNTPSVSLRLILGLDGRLRRTEALEGLSPPPAVGPVLDPVLPDDATYAALVAANRARLEELRQRRYGVPDFRDIFSGGHGIALTAVVATGIVGRAAFAVAHLHLYRPGSLVAVPVVLALLQVRVAEFRKRR
jgi:hypothetical protein